MSRHALHRQGEPGALEKPDFAGRIAHIRDCLAAIGYDTSFPAARSAAARLRLLVALSSIAGGERRRTSRWPLTKTGVLRLAAHDEAVTLLDLGAGGAMLAPIDGLPAGRTLDAALVLDDGPAMPVTIATDAHRVVHLSFVPGAASLAGGLAVELEDWAVHYEMELWRATALANEVERLFETALSENEIEPEDLFSPRPSRHGVRPGRLASRLAALLAQASVSDDLAYVAATSRDGIAACDPMERFVIQDAGARYGVQSRQQGRAGRIIDAVTLRAARFAQKALVQTYRTLPGREPLGVVADIAAPVIVRGRRWGCVRIGRDLPRAARL